MSKRRPTGPKDPSKLGFLERMMFGVMGPPQLGDVDAPARELPARPVELCGKCKQPYSDHDIVRDPGLTYPLCPQPQD